MKLLYIDPGAGSLLLQAIIAGIVSVLVFFNKIKLYIIYIFSRIFGGKKNEE